MTATTDTIPVDFEFRNDEREAAYDLLARAAASPYTDYQAFAERITELAPGLPSAS